MEKTEQKVLDGTGTVEPSFALSPALEKRLDATFNAPDLPSRIKAAKKFQQFYTEEHKRRIEREQRQRQNEAAKK